MKGRGLGPRGLHHSSHYKELEEQDHQRRGSDCPPGLQSSSPHCTLKVGAMPASDSLRMLPMDPPGMHFISSGDQGQQQQHCLRGKDMETALHHQQQKGSHTSQQHSYR